MKLSHSMCQVLAAMNQGAILRGNIGDATLFGGAAGPVHRSVRAGTHEALIRRELIERVPRSHASMWRLTDAGIAAIGGAA